MTVRKGILEYDGLYFITFTCVKWLNLLDLINGYDLVYKWFDHLKIKDHVIVGYVIMPNHVHAMIAFKNTNGKSLNRIIGNGKRFMAYDIVSRLKKTGETVLLNLLSSYVNETDRRRGKLHNVFEPSFDWKNATEILINKSSITFIEIRAGENGIW